MRLDYLVVKISEMIPEVMPNVQLAIFPSISIALTGVDSTVASQMTNVHRIQNVLMLANSDINRTLDSPKKP